MTNWREMFLSLTLILCVGTLLAACAESGHDAASEDAATPAPVIESFDSFEAYSRALAGLIGEYGLTDGADESSPYRTRRILITSEEELEPYPTAVRILHWGNDYVLQFGTAEETREAYEALKNSPLSDFVELDAVLTLDD